MPLTHGATTVGRLSVWYTDGTDAADRVGSAALSSLTTQIACAIQLAEAVGDLNRRKIEGHGLYDILLRVSNQDPTTPVLDAVARHAMTLLHAEGASITVDPAIASSVRFEAAPEAPTLLPDGTAVVARGLDLDPATLRRLGRRTAAAPADQDAPLAGTTLPVGSWRVRRARSARSGSDAPRAVPTSPTATAASSRRWRASSESR